MAAYTGLLTGAGASGGLEALLARMRAEQELAMRQKALEAQIGQQGISNQFRGRELGIHERNQTLDELLAPTVVAQRGASARAANANAAADEFKTSLLTGLFGGGSTGASTGIDQAELGTPNSMSRLRLRAIFGGVDPIHEQNPEQQYLSGIRNQLGRDLTPEELLTHTSKFKEAGRSDLGPEYLRMAQLLFPGRLRAQQEASEAADQRKQMRALQIQALERDLQALTPDQRTQVAKMVDEHVKKTAPFISGFEGEDELANRRLQGYQEAIKLIRGGTPGAISTPVTVPQEFDFVPGKGLVPRGAR